MDDRPVGSRPGPKPATGSPPQSDEPKRRSAADETPLPDEKVTDWEALGSTRILPGLDEVPSGELPPPQPDRKRTIIGEYRLVKKLGEGAMGAVYRAVHTSTDHEVALKLLFPHIASNPKLVERLYREGRVMGQLEHPNIVRGYGIGEDQGWHFVAMEFVDGESLQKWLSRLGRLSVADAVHVTLACARALHYAHEVGVVHRDVKPDNILISRAGDVKVADLGMVKNMDEDMALTQTGHAVGTPWYMPLEQARNAKDIDRRCDIYALGCMLYCLVTGRPPFSGRTIVEVIQAKEAGAFPSARSLNSEVSERLDLIIAKMAAKLPRYRYQTCAELCKDLEGLGLAGTELEFLKTPAKPKKNTKLGVNRTAATLVTERPLVGEKPSDQWFLRHKAAGKQHVRQFSTEKILRLLEENKLDPAEVQASRKADEGFRSLATYKEFQFLVAKQFKEAADQKNVAKRSLYKKIEASERAREEAEEHAVTNSAYWGPILIKIGIGWVVFILVGLFLWYLISGLS